MSPKVYALALSALLAAAFVAIVAANVLIDPQGVFETNLVPRRLNVNDRYRTFTAYQPAEDRYDGLVFGSSRARYLPREELSARMNGVRFADFAVNGGLLTDHVPVLEYALRPTTGQKARLRAVFLLIDIDNFGTEPLTDRYNNTWLPPALSGENRIRFWWRHLVAVQYETWRNTVREAMKMRQSASAPEREQLRRIEYAAARLNTATDAVAADPQPSQSAVSGAAPLDRITSRANFAAQRELLRRVVTLCRDNNVALIVAASPLHRAVEAQYDPLDISRAIDELSRVVPLWDFTGTAARIDRPDFWFGDQSHFSLPVFRLMLQRIFLEPMPDGWEGFGRRRGQDADSPARPIAGRPAAG
jgi:hypothetical protein